MKPPRFLASVAGYRLGYSPQKAYPWPWTTPVGLGILLMSTVLLTCVNIPLAAYDVVQELTYFPNSTLPKLPMSNIFPSFLESSVSLFAPQTWSVGDTFRLNSSTFQFAIASAFDQADNMTPVNSFSYSNVAFSENCDVTNITVSVLRKVDTQSPNAFQYYSCETSAYITCNLPTRVELTATLPDLGYASPLADAGGILKQTSDYGLDLQVALYIDLLGGLAETPHGDGTITITARPCCNCTNGDSSQQFLDAEAQQLLQSPCSSQPARFVASSGDVRNASSPNAPWGVGFTPTGANASDLFDGLASNWLDGYIGSGNLSVLNDPFRNLFQVYYHLLRRDLGVLRDNQIYGSPDMYNRSIVLLNPGVGLSSTPFGTIAPSAAVSYSALQANDTVMQEWRNTIQVFNETDRVPVLEYLRPTPRRKSLGSAITSVFSATFAMVATVWAIFSAVARVLVRTSELRHRAAEDAEWGASKDQPSTGLDESKWDLKEIGYSEGISLAAAHEERGSDDVLEQIAVLRREIYSMRGQLRQRGLLESE
ncbi:hypothetical protein MSAN_01603000 [Mycena sanguinolenta]|uniref:Uncharacterized protein n=1 Tax=Mycena sanguinolenta TaxID=230812 RepID=A0A8H7CV71_9AGAR|nr:hypothetical protein MSAN_01603000 [Mycena sanguinolenta]